MTAIIPHNLNRNVSGRNALGFLFAGLLLLTFIFSSYHQAEHELQSNHMHCQVCWQLAGDLDKPEKSELHQPHLVASFHQSCQQQPVYHSAAVHTATCRGPPGII
ncbi:hypothetical protein [Thalassotalea mangrovi]|uniref:Uncharacterized protein n=1 Tax=Thalassotalea mangrovi TaxID=2572245 RepID=A0A4U1B8N2_9GAMM|nr:hypothetical protein [Thalassotalea mangrovi]TKB47040.1 hypothetical protein E8M12_01920 [Thalassotalea mangrovi]